MSHVFESRLDAARGLVKALDRYRGTSPLVLAIPRGAVPIGAALAGALGGDLDVVLVRKLVAPGHPELAVGAIDETGWRYLAPHAAATGADDAYIDREAALQLDILRKRRAAYAPARAPADPRGRVAIVVDDGIATGATMIAALHAVRAKHPATLVCAVPVASPASAARVEPDADLFVCLKTPREFLAVGQFYRHFPQIPDEEVIALLARYGAHASRQIA